MGIREYPLQVCGEREYVRSKVAGSGWRYGYNVAGILLTSIRDYRPLRFFLSAALGVLLMGIGMALFVAVNFARIGGFPLYIALALGAASLLGLSAILAAIGMLADLLDRQRFSQEELVAYARNAYYDGERRDALSPSGLRRRRWG